MKKLQRQKAFNLFLCSALALSLQAQEVEKPELLVHLGYFVTNNSLQYLQVKTQVKENSKLQAVKDVFFHLYLDSAESGNLIGQVRTNEVGLAKVALPVALKDKWTSAPMHKFIAISDATKTLAETTTELDISKAKIVLDTTTVDSVRMVNVQVLSYENNEWLPAKDVELKLGISRLGGLLKIGEEETYTTDSLGQVSAEFKLNNLPASNQKGNIVLMARVEDNDKFGNLSVEKTIPWGKYYKRESNFGKRSLWATRMHTPIWLLAMAYSIIAGVWSVIIYLLIQLLKIKKLGQKKTGRALHVEDSLLID
jgi:hypothetical protein